MGPFPSLALLQLRANAGWKQDRGFSSPWQRKRGCGAAFFTHIGKRKKILLVKKEITAFTICFLSSLLISIQKNTPEPDSGLWD